jgi:hypothetical protein
MRRSSNIGGWIFLIGSEMGADDLVRVAMYNSQSEAQFVLAALRDNGVDAKMVGEEHSALGLDLDGPDPIEIVVTQAEYDKAKEIIDDLEAAVAEPVPAWTCKCGAEVDEGFDVCWSCGAEYKAK